MMGNIVANIADPRHIQGDALDGTKQIVFENLKAIFRKAGDNLVFLLKRIPVHAEVRPVEHHHTDHNLQRFYADGCSVGGRYGSDRYIIGEN